MTVDFMMRFDSLYGPKMGIRSPTFRAVLREAMSQHAMTVVETGTMRLDGNWIGDGQSTIILNDFMKFRGGSFITIDNSQQAIDLATKKCPEAACICSDSIDTLERYKGTIDLLYLDSFDLDVTNPHPAALHSLMELCAAMPKLHSGSIVFVDDSPAEKEGVITGKGSYVAEYMRKRGILPFTFGYQAAWLLP